MSDSRKWKYGAAAAAVALGGVALSRCGKIGGDAVTGLSNDGRSATISVAPPTVWSNKASSSVSHAEGLGAVYNGLFYALSGIPSGGGSTTSVEAYDPSSNTWSAKAAITTGRALLGGGVIGSTLYAIGGCINSDCSAGLTNVNQAYDFVSNTWSAKAALPINLNSMTTGVINGKLYSAGGMGACGPCTAVTALYVYDPSANSWTTKASMATARRWAAGGVVGGNLYVIGGYNTGMVSSVEVYDPNTDSWTTKSNMLTTRYGAATAILNGIIYVIGGTNGATYLNTVEAYDPATDSWSATTSYPTPARVGMISGAIGNVIYAYGGLDTGFAYYTLMHLFQ